MGTKPDFEWIDTDGDGIPDIFDKEPLIPARNEFERHLQDKREDWHGPQIINDNMKKTIDKCASCEKMVHNERLILYQGFPICLDCWNTVKHLIFKENYNKIDETEKQFFISYRNIRTKLQERMDVSDKKLEKISKKILRKTFDNSIICEKEEFRLNYGDAIEAIFGNLINLNPELIFSLYFNPKTINVTSFDEKKKSHFRKDYSKLFNLNGISIINQIPVEDNNTISTTLNIESSYGNLIIETKLIRKLNEIILENKYTGKAWSNFVEAFDEAIIEIFNIETQKISHHLQLGDLYLSCAEVKEAQDLYYQICIRLKEDQSEHLKKVYNNALAKLSHIYTDLNIIACPLCFQIYENTKEFEAHLEKSHQKKNQIRILDQ